MGIKPENEQLAAYLPMLIKTIQEWGCVVQFVLLNWIGPALDLGTQCVLQETSQQFAVLSVGRLKTSLWMAEIPSISSCGTFSCECSGG